jgi:alkanesulfonate monooxygenase SsuD/methylene tetrahydromethanopterin reductase-like flavin-dependent oxidoreductase (luciferase family)
MEITFGLDTFGDMQVGEDGSPISAAQTIRNLVDEAIFADEIGISHFNVGEHHRDDFSVSAPDSVLAGIATRTKRITFNALQLLMRSQMVEQRSLLAVVLLSNHFHYLDMT